jgi:hypothetical protein
MRWGRVPARPAKRSSLSDIASSLLRSLSSAVRQHRKHPNLSHASTDERELIPTDSRILAGSLGPDVLRCPLQEGLFLVIEIVPIFPIVALG